MTAFSHNDFQLSRLEQDSLYALMERIRTNPELSFQEFKACKWQSEFLKERDFTVISPYCDLPTAYRAEFSSGNGSPVFAFCAEYDALPQIGHGCGHHLISGSAIAAALFLKDFLIKYKLDGKIVLLGCPGEETNGGKIQMAEHHALEDIGALMMAHPTGGEMVVHGEYSGVCSAEVIFSAKKAGSPVARFANPEFSNPIDAQVLLYQAVALKRHYMPYDSAIAGCIPEGGARPNMIPSHTKSLYTIRSSDLNILKDLKKIFKEMAEGAALLTGTKAEVSLSMGHKPTLPSLSLRDLYLENMEKMGMKVTENRNISYGMAATDFGNFSRIRPGTHVHFPLGKKAAAHTWEFAELAADKIAYQNMFTAAKAMALTAAKYFSDPDFRKKVENEFLSRSS